ncbi:MAG: YjbF family lipoprotein [Acetobacteraceae bacterium]|nr:YjbF family lipoprotein [Acetobacteraceae bacterium]
MSGWPRRRMLLGLPLLAIACAERGTPAAGPAASLPRPGRAPEGGAGPLGEPFVPSYPRPPMPPPEALASGGGARPLMAARLGDGPELAMILAEKRDSAEQWLAPGPFVLALKAGRIIRTVNLPGGDLRGVVDETPDPLARPDQLGQARPYRRRLQASDAPPGGLVVESRLVSEGTEPVRATPASQPRTLRRVRETGRALEGAASSWRFENVFWLDPATGHVVASRQEPLPRAPVLALSVIRAG